MVRREIDRVDDAEISLPWIDGDAEAEEFISYWFDEPQRLALRRIVMY